MTSCFDLLLKLSVVVDVVNRCLLLRRLSWAGSQDNICIPVTSLAPHEFLPCLPDLLAYGTQASVLGRLLFFEIEIIYTYFSCGSHFIVGIEIPSQAVDSQIYISSLHYSSELSLTMFLAFLTFLFVGRMGIPTSKCPELRSQHFTPSVHQLPPHFNKWHC